MIVEGAQTGAGGEEKPVPDAAAAQAYRVLEGMLVTLKLPPGSSTTERALIAAVGLGRTPVREAILRLAWEGLLEVRPRSGLGVAPLRPADWLQVIAARRGVEVLLARDAARFAAKAHAALLQVARQAMRQAVAQGDVEGFLEADKALDEAVGQAAGNPYAARLAAPLQAHSRRFWFCFQAQKGLAAAGERHMELADAILANDAPRAAASAGRLLDLLQAYAESVSHQT